MLCFLPQRRAMAQFQRQKPPRAGSSSGLPGARAFPGAGRAGGLGVASAPGDSSCSFPHRQLSHLPAGAAPGPAQPSRGRRRPPPEHAAPAGGSLGAGGRGGLWGTDWLPSFLAVQGGEKQRVFTGIVTSLHDYFGVVDEEVFFQLR